MKWVYSFQIWFQKFTIVENMAVKDNENKWGKFWESLSLHLVERNHQHRPPQSTISNHLKPSPPAHHRPSWSTTTSSNNHHHNQPLPPATNKDHHRSCEKAAISWWAIWNVQWRRIFSAVWSIRKPPVTRTVRFMSRSLFGVKYSNIHVLGLPTCACEQLCLH